VQENSRWWEFYFVRYAIGTLTGAALVNQIPRISEDLAKVVFFGLDLQKQAFAGVSLLIGYGLLFCYVASIPILVWHSARFSLPKIRDVLPHSSGVHLEKLKPVKLGMIIGIIVALGFMLIHYYLGFSKMLTDQDFLIKFAIWIILLVLWLEWGSLVWLITNLEKAYQALKSLSEARSSNANRGGFIDSYRHLREHGNSILIVMLEFVLGGVLLGMLYLIENDKAIADADKINVYATHAVPILLAWMFPGAVMWRVATSFERRFVELEGQYQQQ
jgi:hypothetical protein